MVVAQPVAAADEMDADLHERTLVEGLAEVGRRGIVGKDVTPFLLGWFHERTGGASLAANVAPGAGQRGAGGADRVRGLGESREK